jgi:hypothetical protein
LENSVQNRSLTNRFVDDATIFNDRAKILDEIAMASQFRCGDEL